MKPILFNTKMVQAILEGRKFCTRRICRGLGDYDFHWGLDRRPYKDEDGIYFDIQTEIDDSFTYKLKSPYEIGDILYVRETFFQGVASTLQISGETETFITSDFEYYADKLHEKSHWKDERQKIWMQKRPSIHMPKEAARIFLKVTDVRVERLQDITCSEAKKEGALADKNIREDGRFLTEKGNFIDIWNSTIKKQDLDQYGWDANPWVWVIDFKYLKDYKRKDD